MQSMTHSCQKWWSSSLSCIYFILCGSKKAQRRHTRHKSLVSALCHIPLHFFSQDSSTQDHRCILQKTCILRKVATLAMTHDHQSGYFVTRINLAFGGTWEEISCKEYCIVFADLDFCNPKLGPCLGIILFHLPSTESTDITNHHVLQYLPLQWRCLAWRYASSSWPARHVAPCPSTLQVQSCET